VTTTHRRPIRDAVSAGGVVYRHGAEGIEIVLVSRDADGLYALPKGTPDNGESLEQTAVREVREETGLETEIQGRLGDVRYWFTEADGTRVNKVVHYYLMRASGGSVDDHDHEFDRVGWYHLGEAERLLTHRNQLHILHRAGDLIAKMRA
jgi:8-oxo-dGTP pyrophosphatase MutT (NUDIX family)